MADPPDPPDPPRDGASDAPDPSAQLAAVLTRFEAADAIGDSDEVRMPLLALIRDAQAAGVAPPPEWLAEEMAFALRTRDDGDPASPWDLYFAPALTLPDATTGAPVHTPPLAACTPDVLAYWRRRAGETPHPVLRARYADLLWELPQKIPGAARDPEMARVAVDAYLEAAATGRYRHPTMAIDAVRRALRVALALKDDGRVARAAEGTIALEDAIAKDASAGLWGFSFDALIEPPQKRVPLTPTQHAKVVGDLEARLARFAAGPAYTYAPTGPERAALRLAAYYRRRGERAEVARVLRTYGGIVRGMRGTAAPLVLGYCLERLHDTYTVFDLHADADQLDADLRDANAAAEAELEEVSVGVEVAPEVVDRFFAGLIAGSPEAARLRVIAHFVPRRDAVERQVRELGQNAPLSSLFPVALMAEGGRTAAHLGGIDVDLEGRVVHQTGENLRYGASWLREAMRRGAASGALNGDALLAFLMASPWYPERRRTVLAAGLAAYAGGDSLAAIHILTPQIEEALRHVAAHAGAPTMMARRGGGFHARTLDDLLRDPAVGEALGADVATYLRVLLTDARGWNVRNSVCHGLAPEGMLGMAVADRVVHAMLVLAGLRPDGDNTSVGAADGRA